jgi:hypothetical protein
MVDKPSKKPSRQQAECRKLHDGFLLGKLLALKMAAIYSSIMLSAEYMEFRILHNHC